VPPAAESNQDWGEHIAADLHEILGELRKLTGALAEYAPVIKGYLDNPAARFRARLGGKKE
jgi:hypothetical protein